MDELESGVRNIFKYNKIYTSADPEFIEGDVFKTIIPLTMQASNQDTNQATTQVDVKNNPVPGPHRISNVTKLESLLLLLRTEEVTL